MVKKLLSWNKDSKHSHFGLLLVRIVVGVSFINHGYPKIMGGVDKWEKIGGAMKNVGVDFYPVFWGFMASFSEFFGGMALVLGLLTKVASSGLAFTMFIAFYMHFSQGDSFGKMSHSLELLAVCLLLILGGSGKYSIDQKLG